METYNVLDLFCGTGGFSHGFEASGLGFQTRFGIDVLAIAGATFQANHTNALSLVGDIRKARRHEIAERTKLKRGDVHVIVGGPPCQGFSSIRPFRSTNDDDPRNSLFEEYASFVNYFRPNVFVLENVVGLATHKDGATIAAMEECFFSLGYDCEWRILNAAHFGVPQKRERLIMIGVQRGARIIFPEPTHRAEGATIGYRDKTRVHVPRQRDLFVETVKALKPAVTVLDAIGDLPEIGPGEEVFEYNKPPANDFQRDRRAGTALLSLHNATAHSRKMMEIIRHSGKNISCIPKHLITSGFSSSYSRLDGDEPAVTLTVNFVHPASNRCIHPVQNRALTPREGARLQSFDDDYIFSGNRTQVTKQIGNAVPPLLGRAIAHSVSEILA
ncbi:DNA cytosine methyltransferase [Burkholderia gladioli]|uniref:DNA cytosine methyltransferase n=1 Tax=Burkholderia gladioli TaxID=28095 RepID=UPI00163FCC82|nr:DNA cytosine methyltransferase [Burkholderia gladioli]